MTGICPKFAFPADEIAAPLAVIRRHGALIVQKASEGT
jgi:hypothetical protein